MTNLPLISPIVPSPVLAALLDPPPFTFLDRPPTSISPLLLPSSFFHVPLPLHTRCAAHFSHQASIESRRHYHHPELSSVTGRLHRCITLTITINVLLLARFLIQINQILHFRIDLASYVSYYSNLTPPFNIALLDAWYAMDA